MAQSQARNTFNEICGSFGAWWGTMSGALSIPLALLAILNEWSSRRTFGFLALVAAWVAIFSSVRKNRQLLTSLQPKLEIEGIDFEVQSDRSFYGCIRVHNKSIDKTADNLSVEVTEFEHPVGFERAAGGKFEFPALLTQPHIPISINPGGYYDFTMLDVSRDAKALNGSYLVNGALQSYTTGRSAFLPFKMEEKYRVKIKVTARNFAYTEQAFDLIFSGKESVCRFTLTKVYVNNEKISYR